MFLHVDSEDSVQTARICHFVGFVMLRLKCFPVYAITFCRKVPWGTHLFLGNQGLSQPLKTTFFSSRVFKQHPFET